MKPRGKCPSGGRHKPEKRIYALAMTRGKDYDDHPSGKVLRILPEMGKAWYCPKCKKRWKR